MNQPISKSKFASVLAKGIFPLVLLALGGGAWMYFKATAPAIQRAPVKPRAALVEVMTAQKTDAKAFIRAMGTVVPARQITLRARVSGNVQSMSEKFTPGGRLTQGDELLRLDPSDYEVALQQAASALEKAEADLAIEQGNQEIARAELKLLTESDTDEIGATDLLLRKPQLRQAHAAVESARATLRQARLNLDRTRIRAPFNALVVSREVNLGSHISTQDSLGVLAGTDAFWVEAAVPLDQLRVLSIDQTDPSPAVVRSPANGGRWQGRVLRLAGKLSGTGRMATVIISVSDPLGLRRRERGLPLILDDYVSVEMEARTFPAVVDLPRSALRDADTVWVFADGVLEIRPILLAWRQGDRVFVSKGLAPGDRIITSDLPTPVAGMALMLAGDGREPADPRPVDTDGNDA
jgi:RND family efflux transporter MFP subunit